MGEEVIIVPAFFGVIFAVAYLFFSTRNKERLALIEKGAEASIFVKGRKNGGVPLWKVLALNVSLLMMGIGAGIFLASILHYSMGVDEDVAFPGAIFLTAGLSLFSGILLSKRLIGNTTESETDQER